MGDEEHLAAWEEAGDPAALTGRLFRDMAGALEVLTVYLGERLGLYRALYADGPATSSEILPVDAGMLRFHRLTP